LGDRVRLLGYRTDVLDVLAASDVFLLGSAHEGYPVSLMEALALGLPVVATAVGGIPDAVHTGVEGFLVPPRDPHALAGALIEVAGDPNLRRRMGEAALAASTRFDIRRAADRQCEVYEELAAARRARFSRSGA
jgi:glycosyltransferase involved in cell wall biosynthesis